MNYLLQFWIIRIDFSTILIFVIGILMGMMLLALIYALLVVLGLRDKKYQTKLQANDLSAREAEEMIKIAQEAFKSKELRGETSKIEHFRNVSYDLVYGIASRFYPNSKRPLFELSVDETIELIGYIQKRLDEILSKRILKIFRKYSIAYIMNLTIATTSVLDSKAFEVTKTVSKGYSIGKKIIKSVLDPTWFVRKFSVDVAVAIIMKKLYLACIGIIGEEAYKVYSKSFKNSYEEIDSGVNEIMDSIKTEIKEEFDMEEEKPKEVSSEIKLKKRIYLNPGVSNNTSDSCFDKNMALMKKEKAEVALLEE